MKLPFNHYNYAIVISPRDFYDIGKAVRTEIRQRTEKGFSSENHCFQEYSDNYADLVDKRGRVPAAYVVTLRNTGKMHRSVSIKATGQKVTLYFADSKSGEIAYYHQTGAGNLPVRSHFKLSLEQKYKYIDKISRLINASLKKGSKNGGAMMVGLGRG